MGVQVKNGGQPRKTARIIRKTKYESGQFFQIPTSAFPYFNGLSANAMRLYLIMAKNKNDFNFGTGPTAIANLLGTSIDAAKKYTQNGEGSAWKQLVEKGFIKEYNGEILFFVEGPPKDEEDLKARLSEDTKRVEEENNGGFVF